MPVHVRPRHKGEGGKPFKIVERSGKIVGQSATRAKAEASARARNRAFRSKERPGMILSHRGNGRGMS